MALFVNKILPLHKYNAFRECNSEGIITVPVIQRPTTKAPEPNSLAHLYATYDCIVEKFHLACSSGLNQKQ